MTYHYVSLMVLCLVLEERKVEESGAMDWWAKGEEEEEGKAEDGVKGPEGSSHCLLVSLGENKEQDKV